ncbi:hypothetical protein CANCADRAFT_26290, partial [Tortispora caseinolytica NRRL Y-17796]
MTTRAKPKDIFCDVCDVSFTRPYDLHRHLASHANQPQFTCYVCLRGFARKDSMNRHIRAMHS